MANIGVFDSGIGGLSVANAIEKAFPAHTIIYREDSKNVPYGTKTPEQIYGFVKPILTDLAKTCDIIVIACNTVTTLLIDTLRAEIPIPLVGIEPMVKPASQATHSGVITVCATPATLASARYAHLKEQYAKQLSVIEPDCSDWASLIEKNAITTAKLRADIEPSLQRGADVVVLGCTHYHWIEAEIKHIVGSDVAVLQPEQAIVNRLQMMFSIDK